MSVIGEKIRTRIAPDYKDPYDDRYFGRTATATQWQMKKDYDSVRGARVACVGAKGSAKSYGLSGFHLNDVIQRYPGSKYGIVGNSYAQAYGSGAEKLVQVSQRLGLEFIFRTEMTIDGVRHYNVYHYPAFGSSVCVLSFDQMHLIEGTEWDGFSFEEIQDCEQIPVQTAISRVRRGVGDHSLAASGMPEDEGHWMYEMLPKWGFKLYEPSVYENEKNLPPDYIANLKSLYSGPDAERYINGKRVSLFKNRIFYNYQHSLHVAHEKYSRLTAYDEALPLLICWDFNIAPTSVALFQKKRMTVDDVPGVSVAEIWAQVDEFEGWGVGTEAVCDEILEKYKGHMAGGTVIGDSSGNQRDTRNPTKTDWSIIAERFARFGHGFRIVRGLAQSRVSKSGGGMSVMEPTFHNPPIRETVFAANKLLLQGNGLPGIVFLPWSRLESGGLVKSVANMQAAPDGTIDKQNDKRVGRHIVRSHFADVFRYMAYWATGAQHAESKRWLDEVLKNPKDVIGKGRMRWFA
jgi:hypothetical protein